MSKLINISDSVYDALTKMKDGDSYSDVIFSLIEKTSNKDKILSFAGKGGVDEDKIKELKQSLDKWSKKYA